VVLISDGHGGDEGPRLRDPALGLSAFRSLLYGCFGRRADALFELTDAILTTNTNPSLVHLSLASVHRRGWGSLYAVLNEGRIGAGVLRNLCSPDCGSQMMAVAPASTQSIRVHGLAATPNAARIAGTTTTPAATLPVSPSSPAGPTSSSQNSASSGTPG
jgi:hypothetical protein